MELDETQVSALAERALDLTDDALATVARRLPAAQRAALYIDHILACGMPVEATPTRALAGIALPDQTRIVHDVEADTTPLPVKAPGAVLTERHFDGQTKQRLVQVIRKRPAAAPPPPPEPPAHGSVMQAREDRFVEYVYRHPGCAIGQAIDALKENRASLSKAAARACDAGRIDMRGESKRGMRYWPSGRAKTEAS